MGVIVISHPLKMVNKSTIIKIAEIIGEDTKIYEFSTEDIAKLLVKQVSNTIKEEVAGNKDFEKEEASVSFLIGLCGKPNTSTFNNNLMMETIINSNKECATRKSFLNALDIISNAKGLELAHIIRLGFSDETLKLIYNQNNLLKQVEKQNK